MKMLAMMDPAWVGDKFLTFFTAISSMTQCSKKQVVQKNEHLNKSW